MEVLDPLAAGLLLAGTTRGDGEAREAALGGSLRDLVEAVLARVRGRDREAAVGALVEAIAPTLGSSAAPPRARAVVAALAPRDIGSAWMRDAGAPRVGFRASPALRKTIACTEDDAWRA